MATTGTLRRTAVGVLVAAVAAMAAPAALGAQEPRATPCTKCDEAARRAEARAVRDAARDAAREIRAARKAIQQLSNDEPNATMQQALREADRALGRVDPTSRGAAAALRRAIERLAVQQQEHAAGDAEAYADIVQQLASVQAQLTVAALRRSMAAAAPRAQDSPAGWLGIAYSGEPYQNEPGRGPYFYFTTYPVIEAVDPGSPAAAAGLEARDTIIAIGGRDVRKRKIFLSEVLRPGNKLLVRVQRAGRARDAVVAVKARPKVDPATEPFVAATPPRVRTELRLPAPPAPPGERPIAPLPPPPPTMSLFPGPGAFIWSGPSAVAGAELVKMSGDLREALDLPEGVLVLSVARGTPASNAGLRGGDVIVGVDGEPASTPAVVQRAVQRAHDDERRLELEVIRKSERRTVVLKWRAVSP